MKTDFQQQFPHPKRSNDPVIVEWTRGFGLTRIFYRNRLIGEVSGVQSVLKGVQFVDEQLGKVSITLLKDPFAFEVLIDGLHSPVNRNHPKFNVTQSASNFLLPLIFSILFSWVFLSMPNPDYREQRTSDIIAGLAFAVCAAIYLSSIILIAYRKTAGFFIGATLYLIHYLLFISVTFQPGMQLNSFGWIFLVLMTGQLIFMIFSLRRVLQYLRYRKFLPSKELLLDDNRS